MITLRKSLSAAILLLATAAGYCGQLHPTWMDRVTSPPAGLHIPDLQLSALRTSPVTQWTQRRQEIRREWLDKLGELPQAPPDGIKVEELADESLSSCTRKLVRYEAEPGRFVKAYIVRPKETDAADGSAGGTHKKRPGVVVFHPTNKESIKVVAGTGGRPEQHLALELAERGYVCICPENFINDASSWNAAVAAARRRHPQSTGMATMLADGMRAVDVLAALPGVDPTHLGVIGHSLGAKEALYLMAFDDRVKAGVASEGGIGLKFSNWDADWYLGSQVKAPQFGHDHHELLALIQPRPLLVFGGESGRAADGDRTWPYIQAANELSRQLGKQPAIGFINHRQGHVFSPWMAEKGFAWLDAALKTAESPATVGGFGEVFGIQVVDAQTSRGIPLVVLETMLGTRYVTDSNGFVAFDEPGFMNQRMFFRPVSDGYEYDAPGLAMGGVTLQTAPGTSATLVMRRSMVAERLYRITGAGIYRDSLRLGQSVPIKNPLLNCGVVGQDSALCTPFGGRLFWVWGDTSRLSHPLGNFGSTGAWSELPSAGGLPVEDGIDLHYIADTGGQFVKRLVPKLPESKSGVFWTSCLMTVPDQGGRDHIVAFVDNVDSSMKSLGRRIMEFDPDAVEFRPIADWPTSAPLQPGGHAVRYQYRETTGSQPLDCFVMTHKDYQIYVPASFEAVCDPAQYKRLPGFQIAPVDATTGKSFKPHGCSIAWNTFRKRWTMITSEIGGSSMLGELWYLEAPDIRGPWTRAVKVVTHKNYTIYNPLQHPELTPTDSPYLYFEGTYTKTFSGAQTPTPWYDYNQVMFRLNLRDTGLQAVEGGGG